MSETTQNLLGLAESLVTYGRKKGADQVEVSIDQGSEFSVDIRNGDIEKLQEAGSKRLSLKVIKEQKVATASSSDFTEETLHHLVDSAVERAQLGSADSFAGLPEKEEIKIDTGTLNIFDQKILDLTPDQKISMAKKVESICLKDERIANSYGSSFSNFAGDKFLANSNGFSSSYKRTYASLGVYLQAGEGDNLVEDGWYERGRTFNKLANPETIAKTAVHRVTRLIGAKKIETQNVPIVLEPQMAEGFLGLLYSCISGNAIYRKQSFLVDKIGENVGSDNLSILDDGTMPGTLGSKPFDSEGVPVRKTVVIEKGVLKSYLMNTYAARKLKMKSNGNASGANNFYLKAGAHSPEEIIKSVDKGLLLTGTMGQGFNPVNGDISKGAIGLWIENGEISYPVAEITISGNLQELLKNLEMVGNDLEFRSTISAPTVKFAEITVGGK